MKPYHRWIRIWLHHKLRHHQHLVFDDPDGKALMWCNPFCKSIHIGKCIKGSAWNYARVISHESMHLALNKVCLIASYALDNPHLILDEFLAAHGYYDVISCEDGYEGGEDGWAQ